MSLCTAPHPPHPMAMLSSSSPPANRWPSPPPAHSTRHRRSRCRTLPCLPLLLVLLLTSLSFPVLSLAYPLACSSSTAAVTQNCYLYLSTALPLLSPSTPSNPYPSRYDCALALSYYLPCLLSTANASYDALYAALSSTPCLLGARPPALPNHTQLTVVEVDSAGNAGSLSSYRHDNSTLNGNVGSCVGSVSSQAAAAVSFGGAQCCSVDHGLTPIAQQALSTLQAGISKSTYRITPLNAPVPPNTVQAGQAATAALACSPAGLPPFPVTVHCSSLSALYAQAALVNEYCYFNPLWALPSSAPASFSQVPCALAWGEFALCQLSLSSASAAALSAAAARLSSRAHAAVVNATSSSGCCNTAAATVAATATLLQAAYSTLTGVGNCVYTPPQLPIAPVAPCLNASLAVSLYCQFNPRLVLPTTLPPYLNKTECAVPFLSYAVCVLLQVNQTGCNNQRTTLPISLITALLPDACNFDNKLLPLISRAITTVQTANTTTTPQRRVNGVLCTATPAAVYSSCLGLDVNAAYNSSGLSCPSMACAVAYASYAACFLAMHPCTAPTASVKYPACPDAAHQVSTFLATCYTAVLAQSFTGYLHAPPPPVTGCTSTALSSFVAYVEPTLSVPSCSVSSLFGGLTAAVLYACSFYPLLPPLPTLSTTCSVQCAWALTAYTQCQQRLVLSAINQTLLSDASLTPLQSRLLPVVQPSPYSASSCSLGQSCSGDVHLAPYLSTCLTSLQSLPLLTCPATANGQLCTSTPAAVSTACLGLNVNNFTLTSGYTCPSRACAVAYAQYASCYLRQTPCMPVVLQANGTYNGSVSACPDLQGQVYAFLSICYQAALSNAYTGYLFPPPGPAGPRCNYTAISIFQQAVYAPASPVITGSTPCTAATLRSAFAPAVAQDCYFNPLLTAVPTYTGQCSVACAYALTLYLRCYAAVSNATVAVLAQARTAIFKGTPPVVVSVNTSSSSGSLSCGVGVACSFPVPSAQQAYAATCLQQLQTASTTCLPVPSAIIIPPAPTTNLTLLDTTRCVAYAQPVLVTCSLYVQLPIAFGTISTRFPTQLLSKECATSIAQYAVCYLNAQPIQAGQGNATCNGACSLNQDVVTLAHLAVTSLQNATVVDLNPTTLSLISVDQEQCSGVAPLLPSLCGVQLSADRVTVNPGVTNCTIACAQQLTVYAECRLRSTAVCAGHTYPVQGAGGVTSVTIPAYPTFPYPQASTNASVGQGRCVDVDGSLYAFLSFCNLTLTGTPLTPHPSSSSSTAAAASSSVSSSLSSSRVSSSAPPSSSAAPSSSPPSLTSAAPSTVYNFSMVLTMVGVDFSVVIDATLSCVLATPPIYGPNSVFIVVGMQGVRTLTAGPLVSTSLITAVAGPDSLGNNDNTLRPLQSPVLTVQGLAYLLSPAGALGDVAGNYSLINLYPSNFVYREEGSGVTDITVSSTLQLVPLFPTQSSSSLPSTAPPSVTSSPTSSQLLSSSPPSSSSSTVSSSASSSSVSSSLPSSSVAISSAVSSSVASSSALSSSPASSSLSSSAVSSSVLSSSAASSSAQPSSSVLSSSPASSSPLSSSAASSSAPSSSVTSILFPSLLSGGVSPAMSSGGAVSSSIGSSSAIISSSPSTASVSSPTAAPSSPASSPAPASPPASSAAATAPSSSPTSPLAMSTNGSSPVTSTLAPPSISSSAGSSSALSSSPAASSPLSSSISSAAPSAAPSSLSSAATAPPVAATGTSSSTSTFPGSCASAAAIYATFSTNDLPAPLFWLSASTLSPTTTSVTSWPDLTLHLNGGNSSSTPPAYIAGVYHGLPAVRFNGSQDVQAAPVHPTESDWTVVLVMALTQPVSNAYVFASRASADHSLLIGGSPSPTTVIWYSPASYGVPSGGSAVAGIFPVPAAGTPFVLSATYSYASQLLHLFIDGRPAGQIGYPGAYDSSIALANGFWSGNQFAGDMMEALLFDVNLDDAPRAYLEQTLLNLYNGTAACG